MTEVLRLNSELRVKVHLDDTQLHRREEKSYYGSNRRSKDLFELPRVETTKVKLEVSVASEFEVLHPYLTDSYDEYMVKKEIAHSKETNAVRPGQDVFESSRGYEK